MLARAEQHARRNPYAVWLTGCGVYFLALLHRSSLGVAGPDAVDRLHISAAQLGVFVMLQLGVYAAMQVPAGLAIDRFGPRKVLLIATITMGTAQIVFAFATNYPMALGARAVLGMGDAAVYLSVLRLAAIWFPRRRYAMLAMLSGLFGMAGNLAATLPLTLALDRFGWVETFAVTGATSLVYALLLLRPAVAAPYRDVNSDQDPSERRGWRGVLRDVATSWRGGDLGHGTQLGFWTHQATMSSQAVLGMVWGFPYLTEGLGYSDARAASELSVMVIANVAASLVIGPYAGRRPGARMPMAIMICLLIMGAWALLLGWPGGIPPHAVVTGALAVIASGGPASQIGFHLARDYNPQHRISTATGLVNVGGFSGAMLGAVLVGLILDARSGQDTPGLLDYRWALASVAILTAASTVAMIVVLLSQRAHSLERISAGQPVVIPMVAHWWDFSTRSRRNNGE